MTMESIGINLRRLRKGAGLSQAALASRAGLSVNGYRKLERGETEAPRPDSLKAIARALEVPLSGLLVEVKPLERVRFRSLKRLKTREQILADVTIWLQDFAELEALTSEHVPHALDALWQLYRQYGAGRIPEFAAQVRAEFRLSEREPVHDICGLLEARGIKVRSVSVPNDAFMGLSVAAEEVGGPAIVVNTWDRLPVETWIFSAVHELGHLLMHLGAYDVNESSEDADQEKAADRFASHFLMPEAAFRREWEEAAGLPLVTRVMKVKRVFRVSWRTVLFRIAEGLPPDKRAGVWAAFNREFRRERGRSLLKHDEPAGVDGEVYQSLYSERPAGEEPSGMDAYDFKEDRLSWLVRKALEERVITLSRGAEILQLPTTEFRELTASWVA